MIKKIPGYEELYTIDELGKVRNKDGKEIKITRNRVVLCKDGKYQSISLKLLAMRTIGLSAVSEEMAIVELLHRTEAPALPYTIYRKNKLKEVFAEYKKGG